MGYTGNLCNNQWRCNNSWKGIVHDKLQSSRIHLSPANQTRIDAFAKVTDNQFGWWEMAAHGRSRPLLLLLRSTDPRFLRSFDPGVLLKSTDLGS